MSEIRAHASIIAIDGKGFFRRGFRSSNGKYSEFRAVLGTAVKIKDKEDFKVKEQFRGN